MAPRVPAVGPVTSTQFHSLKPPAATLVTFVPLHQTPFPFLLLRVRIPVTQGSLCAASRVCLFLPPTRGRSIAVEREGAERNVLPAPSSSPFSISSPTDCHRQILCARVTATTITTIISHLDQETNPVVIFASLNFNWPTEHPRDSPVDRSLSAPWTSQGSLFGARYSRCLAAFPPLSTRPPVVS